MIMVNISACHAGGPGLIPDNNAMIWATVLSHPEGYDPSSQGAGYSILSPLGMRGTLSSNIGP